VSSTTLTGVTMALYADGDACCGLLPMAGQNIDFVTGNVIAFGTLQRQAIVNGCFGFHVSANSLPGDFVVPQIVMAAASVPPEQFAPVGLPDSGKIRACTPPTGLSDCGCTLTGNYLDPLPPVPLNPSSAGGGYSVTSTPTVTGVSLALVRVADNVTLFTA